MSVVVEPKMQSVNTFGRWEMPWSEVCMYMRIAGKVFDVEVLAGGMAQLYRLDGSRFSFPVTQGEAGVPRSLRT